MAGGGASYEDVDMAGTGDADTVNKLIPSIEVADAGGPTRRTSTGQGLQHKREKSVEMVLHDGDKTAYETPHSGTSSAGSAGEAPTVNDIPPIDEQIAQVTELASFDSLKEGKKGYIISNKWLYRVLSRGSKNVGKDKDKYGKDVREGPIGPVDNSGLDMIIDPAAESFKDEMGDPFIALRPGMQLGEDFEILPETAWNLVISWYGMAKESPTITRYCHNTSPSETVDNFQYELFPPVFTILKLPDRSGGMSHKDLKEKDATPVKILASRHERFVDFLRRAKNEVNIDIKVKVRVWRILGGLKGSQSGVLTPAQSRASSPAPGVIIPVDPGNKLVLDVNTFIGLQHGSEREDIDVRDETGNAKYNGKSNLDFVGLRQDCVLVLEEQIQGPGGGEWVSDGAASSAKSNGVPITISRSGVVSSLKPTNSRGASPAPSGGMMTRGRQTKVGKMKGTCGLTNLGNTCYMNSALQCVRSVEELTMYFLEACYKKELNPDNPLGNNGQVAKAYANLLHEMYHNSNQSLAPRSFKNTIGKYGPSFSGYGQQDSQEFLLFLLDGLQEDLNRIHKKPYIEKPDSTDEMVNDPVALHKMADACWDIYKKRSDSVITDLFAGMYKSTLTCPVCDKVSIIFDPFNNLTLQLPIENPFQRRILFFPLHDRPINIDVDINKNATFFALKQYISEKIPGADPKRLMTAEPYNSRFYKFYDDNKALSEETIADGDVVGVWEIEDQPTNYPPPKQTIKKPKAYSAYSHNSEDVEVPDMESPVADKILVSIFNRRPAVGGTRYASSGKELFGKPGFIILTREEARDHDAILKKVLASVATLTTRDFLREEEGLESATGDSDTILTSAEDAEMEPKVHAESLESEDGMVDISMKEQADRDFSDPAEQHGRTTNRKPLPKMIQPSGEITDAVRNLFEMKVVTTNNEMVPTGWSSFNNDNFEFPPLADRCREDQRPQVPTRKSAMEIISNTITNDESISSDEDIEDPPQIMQPLIPDDDDSDSGLPEVQQIQSGKVSGSLRTLTTYSKKGKQPSLRGGGHDEPMEDANDGFLIRLGESILLEWAADASDELFLSPQLNSDDGMRGLNTWEQVPVLPDPALVEKKRYRNDRKKNGISLGECLDEFGKPEILSENDAWYCPRCKEHRRASKKFELWRAPDILVIHLKRFRFQGRLRDKIEVKVDFPLEGLELQSRLAVPDGEKSSLYDLIAVDNHYGGLGGGHYTAFAQNFVDKNWYEYNDSIVSKRSAPQSQVVSSAAYLLFYRRRSDTPLGGPFFEEILASANRDPSEPPSDSRAQSPAGEGRRLDATSSRNGSSSALRGVGAAHQAGGGGAAGAGAPVAKMRTGIDDELPAYSAIDPQQTLEEIDIDVAEDEAVGDLESEPRPITSILDPPAWSFQDVNNSPDDGNGFGVDPDRDDASNQVQSTAGSDREDRMLDFDDDPGTTQGGFCTPPPDARVPEVPWHEIPDNQEEPAVTEIRHDADAEADELA